MAARTDGGTDVGSTVSGGTDGGTDVGSTVSGGTGLSTERASSWPIVHLATTAAEAARPEVVRACPLPSGEVWSLVAPATGSRDAEFTRTRAALGDPGAAGAGTF